MHVLKRVYTQNLLNVIQGKNGFLDLLHSSNCLLGLWKEGVRDYEETCTFLGNVKVSKAHSASCISIISVVKKGGLLRLLHRVKDLLKWNVLISFIFTDNYNSCYQGQYSQNNYLGF